MTDFSALIHLAWRDNTAACAHRPLDLWFPTEYRAPNEAARQLCLTCPLVEPCRRHGIDHERHGTWGGLTERDRELVRKNTADGVDEAQAVAVILNRRRKPKKALKERKPSTIKCGSDSGYTKHKRDGTPPCTPCRDAHARANRERNRLKESA